jgi:acetyl-CoA acyltransferase
LRTVFVIGIGMTCFGRHLDQSCSDLAAKAVGEAMNDAGISPKDINIAFYANVAQGVIEGQFGIRGSHALRPLGVNGAPIIDVENACTSSTTAFNLAYTQIASGCADVALAVGVEKLNTEDPAKKFAVFNNPLDLSAAKAFVDKYSALVEDILPPPHVKTDEGMRSVFMDIYSVNARLHMKRYGTTWEQMAKVCSKNHQHSTMNPRSQFQHAISLEEVLAARIISWPLTLPMCAPVSDGATAAVLCSSDVVRRFNVSRAVKVYASMMQGGSDRDITDLEHSALRLAATKAYDSAGVGPMDMDLAEVHDASAFAEISQVELLQLCPLGEGGPLALSGATSLGGSIPVNVSGGLESKGHPIAATGLAQVHELVEQLRGETGARQVQGARLGIAANSGGFLGVEEAVSCVTILGRA